MSGFVPCDTHAAIEDLSSLLGRSLEEEPQEFAEFLETELSYDDGLEVYGRYGKASFFKKCWEGA